MNDQSGASERSSVPHVSDESQRVELRNPYVAALLAFLLPGLGHWYQRRWFKAAVYSICILSTFFWGLHLGQWRIVYFDWQPGRRRIGYLAQVLVGLPALPALVQSWRYKSEQQAEEFTGGQPVRVETLSQPLEAHFRGRLVRFDAEKETLTATPIEGELKLHPAQGEYGPEVRGLLTGTLDARTDVVLQLSEPVELGPRLCAADAIPAELLPELPADGSYVYTGRFRYVKCHVKSQEGIFQESAPYIEGTVPRPFWDWFEVPLEEDALEDLHRTLGKYVELAQVLTWIAGLLNLLAIWDALDGPAYGYGDEDEEESGKKEKNEKNEKTESSKEKQ